MQSPPDNPECAKIHTPRPAGYVEFFEWCEMMSKRGLGQIRCEHCGLFAVWVDKAKARKINKAFEDEVKRLTADHVALDRAKRAFEKRWIKRRSGA